MDPSRSGKSVELETLEECLPAIQNFLSGRAVDLRWFAGKLMKEGLIHRQAADSILNRLGTTNMERACGLMDAVVAQVEVDEEKYHRFCSILHDEGTLSGLDTMLKKAYETHPDSKQGSAKPLKSPNQYRPQEDQDTTTPKGGNDDTDSGPSVSDVQKCINEKPGANGLVVIVTNDYGEGDMKECHEDGEEMRKTFEDTFKFACLWKKNLTALEIIKLLECVGNCDYLPSYKCIAVAFSGHGGKGTLKGNDWKFVSVKDDFLGPLQPGEMPNMREVPKLFFIDACQGDYKMVFAKSKGERENVEEGQYIAMYATMRGYKAYIHTKWMQKIAKKLRDDNDSVPNIASKVAKEVTEEDPSPVQRPECSDTYSNGPVYLKQMCKAQPKPSGQGPSQHEATESQRSAEPLVQPKQQRQQAQLDKSGEDETDYKSPDEEPLYPDTHKDEIDKEKEPYTDPLDTAKYEKIKEFAEDIQIIIQCCNKYEYFACLDRMETPDSTMFNRSVRHPCATLHIVVGMFAERKAAIIWTKQGSEELRKACDLFPNSKAIIGVGVCYGMNRKTVKFCDVIVSSQVVDCGDRPRLDKEGFHPRGEIIETGPTLENTFCKEDSKWVFCCVKNPKERKSKAIIGQIISAPFLLDSKEITEKLMEKYEDAKGGEMEGWVLYTKDFSDRETIVIKGVADYADGKKDKKWQLTAAMAAADYTHYMLMNSPAFLYEDYFYLF